MSQNRFFHDAQRHDFEPGRRLQLREVGERELAAIDRRLVALIEERRDGHAAQLRKWIVHHRLMGHFPEMAAAESAKQDAGDECGAKRPVVAATTKHRLDGEPISSPPASKTTVRKDTVATVIDGCQLRLEWKALPQLAK